jgi:purine-cytosine permease-like protein
VKRRRHGHVARLVGSTVRKLRGGGWIAYNVGVAAFDSDLAKFKSRKFSKPWKRLMWLVLLCCAAVLQGVAVVAAYEVALLVALALSPVVLLWVIYSKTSRILDF